MSTKKNILYNLYIETKIILNNIVVKDVFESEHRVKLKKLEEIEVLYNAVQKKLLKETQDKSVNTDNSEGETNAEIFNELSGQTSSADVSTGEKPSEDESEQIDTSVDFLELRKQVEGDYLEKIARLKKLYPFELFYEYKHIFNDYNFLKLCNNTLGELFTLDNLSSTEFTKKANLHIRYFSPSLNSFNIKYILYMEDFLFFWHLQTLFSRRFWKLKKIKFKKKKFKKKKLRKLYVLKKIKKFVRFKRFKRKSFFVFQKLQNYMHKFSKLPKNILVQKIPLTEKVLTKYNVEFFYKLNKKVQVQNFRNDSRFTPVHPADNKFVVYSRNYHQKPYWKLRKSRILHWNMFYKKTIRKQRYESFLTKFMKRYMKLSYDYTFLVNIFTKFCISWTRTSKFPSIAKLIMVYRKDKIVKLPLFFNKVFKWRFLKKRSLIAKKKIGRWSFLNFKRFKCPWLQRKKRSPKNVNHIQPNLHSFLQLGSLDRFTGYVLLNSEVRPFTLPVFDTFKTNNLIRLHVYRYKSNRRWI